MQAYPGPNSLVILDNASIHGYGVELRALVGPVGAKVLFLPPYSPDFNPIEKLFGWLKQWLWEERDYVFSVPAKTAIACAFESLALQAPQACKGWIEFLPFYNN